MGGMWQSSPLTVCQQNQYDFSVSRDCYDWELGEHGIRIDFIDKQLKERTATFLPQVPIQCGWSKKHTIKRLIQKSGCTEKVEFDENGFPPKYLKLKTIRYRSSLASVTHDEYIAYSNTQHNNIHLTEDGFNSHMNGLVSVSNGNGHMNGKVDESDEDDEEDNNMNNQRSVYTDNHVSL